MRLQLTSAALVVWFSSLVLLPLGESPALAADHKMRFEVQLVWGTQDAQSPDPKHKPVEPEVAKSLKKLPLKWAYYYEVNRKMIEIPAAGPARAEISEKCAVEIKRLQDSTVEVSFIGKGKPVERRQVTLPVGEILVYGGNAPNETAWLVILKRLQ